MIKPSSRKLTFADNTITVNNNIIKKIETQIIENKKKDKPKAGIELVEEPNLKVEGSITAVDGNYIGDVSADNISLLGNIVTTDANITRNLSSSNINTNNLTVNNLTKSPNIITDTIITNNMSAPIDTAINISNVRYTTNINQTGIISPAEIKLSKIFIVNTTTIINGDLSCDGIEIIIYNNANYNVVIRDNCTIIKELKMQRGMKMVYIGLIGKWIII